MDAWVARGTVDGSAGLIARRGQIVYAGQFGYLDRRTGTPMPSDAIFRIYSMTKPIVCTALMTLYEEGRFQLHTPVDRFIPALGQVKVLEQDAAGAARHVDLVRPPTVGELMAHMGGFTYDFLEESPVGELYRQAELLHDSRRTLEQFVQELVRLPLAAQPGTRWLYSVSIDVAAYLIELLADQPLRQFLAERFFNPLGMVDTDFGVAEGKRSRLAAMVGVGDLCAPGMTHAKMYAAWEQGVLEPVDAFGTYPIDRPETFARGGHGLFSTAADYMRFALMLHNQGELDGVRLLGRKTLELMHANRVRPDLLPLTVEGEPIAGYGFGLGSRVLMDVGLAGVPGSVGEYGWAGAASTYYWVDPAEQMVGVFMTQYQGDDEPNMDFRSLAYQAIMD
jgi:CubicO group peptidase (beta-lactamase class C family)